MIRYIHIGDQIMEGNQDFAFWDTAQDRFVQFAGEQVFEDLEEFKEYYNLDSHLGISLNGSRNPIDRYICLMPKPTFK